MNEQYQLNKELNAAITLKASLADMADDVELIADMIEGETDLNEMIGAVFLSIDEDEILVTGIDARTLELSDRKLRLKKRIDAKRASIEQAMSIGEIKKIEAATFTLSLKKVAAGLVINDESIIPTAYWKPQDPRLDKKAVKDALKDDKSVPGATLDNGGIALAIRRK